MEVLPVRKFEGSSYGSPDSFADGLDLASAAAMLIDYLTAHYALFERAVVRPGETVLVLGAAGGVGSAAVQLAARAGAYVIAAASSEEKGEGAGGRRRRGVRSGRGCPDRADVQVARQGRPAPRDRVRRRAYPCAADQP